MAKYVFDDLPNQSPVAREPVNDTRIVCLSCVELTDDQVFVVYTRSVTSSPVRMEVKCGYATNVAAILGGDSTVTIDRTLVTNNDSGGGRGNMRATVQRHPSDATKLLLWIWGAGSTTYTWDASIETPTTTDASWVCLWESSDEGDTFDFVCEMHNPTAGSNPVGGPCLIEAIPRGGDAGRWIVGLPDGTGSKFFYSDNSGTSWTAGLDGGSKSNCGGFGFIGSSSQIYMHAGRDGLSGGFDLNCWYSLDGGETGTVYSTFNPRGGGSNVGKGVGFFATLEDDQTLMRWLWNGGDESVRLYVAENADATWTDEQENDTDEEPGGQWKQRLSVTGFPGTTWTQNHPVGYPTSTYLLVCSGTHLIGVKVVPSCPATSRLHIPWKRWPDMTTETAQTRAVEENVQAIRRWIAEVERVGAATERNPVRGDPRTPKGNRELWLGVERWAGAVCWTDKLHIPHKGRPDLDYWNLLRFERWAERTRG